MSKSGKASPEAIRRARKHWSTSERGRAVRRVNRARLRLAVVTDPAWVAAEIEEAKSQLAFHLAELARIESTNQRKDVPCSS